MTKILAWSDSPIVSTGFGTVAKHIYRGLLDAGHEIELIGINQLDTWYDQKIWPMKIHSPLTLFGFNKDQFGVRLTIEHILKDKFDVLFTINDRGILNNLVPTVREARKKKDFKWIIYMPHDWDYLVEPESQAYDCIREADTVVLFHEDVRKMYVDNFSQYADKIISIHHGVDNKVFHKLSPSERKQARSDMFQLKDDDFLIINVNRNQPRKDLPRTLEIFKQFRVIHPEAKLFLNCKQADMGGDILTQAVSLGLPTDSFYINPEDWSENKGHSIEKLNDIYNCADVYLSTTLGEGWGLTSVEAMACGTPVLLPDNTSARTIIGNNERGYLLPCGTNSSEWVLNKFDDAKRPLVNIDKALEQLEKVYKAKNGDTECKPELRYKLKRASEWIENNTWDIIVKQWLKIF